MAAAVALRGSDGQGVWADERIGLGHALLAIIDLTDAAAQSAADRSGELHIVYKCEIYNHRELCAELIGLGHWFKNQSDWEVLIEGYKRWGLDVLQLFNGMSAFA